MACSAAKQTDQYHGWECTITEGECMFLNPNSKLCAEKYGEGPDSVEEKVENAILDEDEEFESEEDEIEKIVEGRI